MINSVLLIWIQIIWVLIDTSMVNGFHKSFSEKYKVVQGDILVPIRKNRNAILDEVYKWPNGVVPYTFHNDYSDQDKERVRKAFTALHDRTCVRFVEKNAKHIESVRFYKEANKGCFAMIGRRPGLKEPMVVNFSPVCLKINGAMQHELMHVLGVLHEQSRPDRDDYINVYWDNIPEEQWVNFVKINNTDVTTFDLPYDYQSLMHYPNIAFSKNRLNTLEAKIDQKMVLGQSKGCRNPYLR